MLEVGIGDIGLVLMLDSASACYTERKDNEHAEDDIPMQIPTLPPFVRPVL